jgi:hypothetical protein
MSSYDVFTRDMMPEIHRVSTLPHCNSAVWLSSEAKENAAQSVRMTQMKKHSGNHLRTYRVESNYSLPEVSKITGCSIRLISVIERDTGYLSENHKIKLKPFYGDLVYREMVL